MTTILDVNGNPIDLSAICEPQTEQPENRSRVQSMQTEFAHHPGRGLTPAKLNAILTAAEQGDLLPQLDLADDMEERDGHIFSQLSVRKDAVANIEWDVEPPENATPEEEKWAEAAKEMLAGIPDFEEDILRELLDGILKGFKAIEMWWALDGKQLLPRFKSRPQRWFTLNEQRDTITLRDNSAWGQPLKPGNWLLHEPRSRSGYPGRTSLARVLAWPYLFKNYAIRDLAELLEIWGLPLRVGKYPTGASDQEKRTLLQALVSIGHNAAGIIPAGMEIDFKAIATGTDAPFRSMGQWMEDIQSKAILGQTLTSGEGQHGTQALGTVHDGVRMTICKSDAKRLASTVTSQLIAPYILINFAGADRKRLPKFCIDVPEPTDLALYADALPKLAQAGMRFSIPDLHRRLSIPKADEGEEILKGPPAPVAPMPGNQADPAAVEPGGQSNKQPNKQPPIDPKAKPPAAAKVALSATLPSDPRDGLSDLVDAAVSDWRPVLEPMIAPLMAELQRAVDAGESLADFQSRLPGLIDSMDSRPQAERLARTAFLARLAGEADLQVNPDETH